jgi:hypothetical protein
VPRGYKALCCRSFMQVVQESRVTRVLRRSALGSTGTALTIDYCEVAAVYKLLREKADSKVSYRLACCNAPRAASFLRMRGSRSGGRRSSLRVMSTMPRSPHTKRASRAM